MPLEAADADNLKESNNQSTRCDDLPDLGRLVLELELSIDKAKWRKAAYVSR